MEAEARSCEPESRSQQWPVFGAEGMETKRGKHCGACVRARACIIYECLSLAQATDAVFEEMARDCKKLVLNRRQAQTSAARLAPQMGE